MAYRSLKNMPKKGKIIRRRKIGDGFVMLTIKGPRGKEYKRKVSERSRLLDPIPGWDGKLVVFNVKPDTGKIWNIRRQRN